MDRYRQKNILVIGAGRSGIAVSGLLSRSGASVMLTDKVASPGIVKKPAGIETVFGCEDPGLAGGMDIIIPSPGVPPDNPILREARKKDIEVLSELEIAYSFLPGPSIIAVTGTNGKTTTATLISEILEKSCKDVILCGNIGNPVSSVVERVKPSTKLVIEVSSYQLEYIKTFRPDTAVFLNFTPDHLSHHKTLKGYLKAKCMVFKNMRPRDFSVLNYDDKRLHMYRPAARGKRIFYSILKSCVDVYVDKNNIICVLNGFSFSIPKSIWKLPGPHNLSNALAAVAACSFSGVDPVSISRGLRSFKGVEHRLERIGEVKGRVFYNDSKATNVDSTKMALQSLPGPMVIIMGGQHKGLSYRPLAALIRKKARALIFVGESAGRLYKDLHDSSHVYLAQDMDDAVNKSFRVSRSGDTVLLSPAAASFDMFRDYEHRGRVFKRCVKKLIKKYS